MENASKALVIAGGILIALMILSILVYVFISISDFEGAQDRNTLTKQLDEFNKSYEAYNKSRMYGVDVISVVNKATENNEKYPEDKVNIIVLDGEDNQMQVEDSHEFKVTIFKCEKVEYNEKTGKINLMEFRKISINS